MVTRPSSAQTSLPPLPDPPVAPRLKGLSALAPAVRLGKSDFVRRLLRPCERLESRQLLQGTVARSGALGRTQQRLKEGLYWVFDDHPVPRELGERGEAWEAEVHRALRLLGPELVPAPMTQAAMEAQGVPALQRDAVSWTVDGVLAQMARERQERAGREVLGAEAGERLFRSVWGRPSALTAPVGWAEPGGELQYRLEVADMVIDLLSARWMTEADRQQTVLVLPPEEEPWAEGRSWIERQLTPVELRRGALLITPLEIKHSPKASRSYQAELAWYAAWLLRLMRSAQQRGLLGNVTLAVSPASGVWVTGRQPLSQVGVALRQADPLAALRASLDPVDLSTMGRELSQFMAAPPRPGSAFDSVTATTSSGCVSCLEYRPEESYRRRELLRLAPLEAQERRRISDELRSLVPGASAQLSRVDPGLSWRGEGAFPPPPAATGCLRQLLAERDVALLPGITSQLGPLRAAGILTLADLQAVVRRASGAPDSPEAQAARSLIAGVSAASLSHLEALCRGEVLVRPGVHLTAPPALLSVGLWVTVRRGRSGQVHSVMVTMSPQLTSARTHAGLTALRGRLEPAQIALGGPGVERLPNLMAEVMEGWLEHLAAREDVRVELMVWNSAQQALLREALMAATLAQHELPSEETEQLSSWRNQVRPARSALRGWLASLLWNAATTADRRAAAAALEVGPAGEGSAGEPANTDQPLELLDDSAQGAELIPELPFPAAPSPSHLTLVLGLIESAFALPVAIERAPVPVFEALTEFRETRAAREFTGEGGRARIFAPQGAVQDALVLASALLSGARDLPDPQPALTSGQEQDWLEEDYPSPQFVVGDVDPGDLDLGRREPLEELSRLLQLTESERLKAGIDLFEHALFVLLESQVDVALARQVLRDSGLSDAELDALRAGRTQRRLYADPDGADRFGGLLRLPQRPQRAQSGQVRVSSASGAGIDLVRTDEVDLLAELPMPEPFGSLGRALREHVRRAASVAASADLARALLASEPDAGARRAPGAPVTAQLTGRALVLPARRAGPLPRLAPASGSVTVDPRAQWVQTPEELFELVTAPDLTPSFQEAAVDSGVSGQDLRRSDIWRARADLLAAASWRHLENLELRAASERRTRASPDDLVSSGEAVGCALWPGLLSAADVQAGRWSGLQASSVSVRARAWLASLGDRLADGDLLALLDDEVPSAGRRVSPPGLREGDSDLIWSPAAVPGVMSWPMKWHEQTLAPPTGGRVSTRARGRQITPDVAAQLAAQEAVTRQRGSDGGQVAPVAEAVPGGAVGQALADALGGRGFGGALAQHPAMALGVRAMFREFLPEGGHRDWLLLRSAQGRLGGAAVLGALRALRLTTARQAGLPGFWRGALIQSGQDHSWRAIDVGMRALQARPVTSWPLMLQRPVDAAATGIQDLGLAVSAQDVALPLPGGGQLVPQGTQAEVVRRLGLYALTLCWGPPGTGKSATISQALLGTLLQEVRRARIARQAPRLRVLVCAPTYEACDNLLEKLAEQLPQFCALWPELDPSRKGPPLRLWRVAAQGRGLAGRRRALLESLGRRAFASGLQQDLESAEELGPISLIEVDQGGLGVSGAQGSAAALEALWSGREALYQPYSEFERQQARDGQGWDEALLEAAELSPGIELVFAGGQQARRLSQWSPADVLVIDEASQVDLPVAALMCGAAGPRTRVLVCGDDRQLAPVRPLPDPSPDRRSLMDWLSARGTPRLQLTTSYRSVPEIIDTWVPFGYGAIAPSERTLQSLAQLRQEGLEPDGAWLRGEVSDVQELRDEVREAGLSDEDFSALALVTQLARPGVHVMVQSRGQLATEADLAAQLGQWTERARAPLGRLRRAWPGSGRAQGVGVVLPRRGDVTTAAAALRALGLLDEREASGGGATGALGAGLVRVDTVDRYQGQEADLVLSVPLPLTLEEPRAPLGDAQAFALEPRRLCVAFSRARRSLVVVLPRVFLRTAGRPSLQLAPHGSGGDDHSRLGYEVLSALVHRLCAGDVRSFTLPALDALGLGQSGGETEWLVWSRESLSSQELPF